MEHITINNKICTGCGICIDSCPFGAIEIENGAAKITDGCRICGSCIESCPAGAIELIKENELKTDLSAWRSILVFAQQQGNGPAINPGTVQHGLPQAFGKTPIFSTKAVVPGVIVHALGDISNWRGADGRCAQRRCQGGAG